MSDEYTPTTDEIRDYVEVGGEPQPWLPPTPDRDAARAAAFDRWLADHDERVKAEAKAEQREADIRIALDENERLRDAATCRDIALAIRAAAENGESNAR